MVLDLLAEQSIGPEDEQDWAEEPEMLEDVII